MNSRMYPPALRPGDLIRIVSPAGPVDEERLKIGIERLQSWGYRVELGMHALDRTGFLAGIDEARLSDLTDALLDEDVKCVFCSRGGYGVLRLMEDIPWQRIADQNPKPLIGFSDISAFQLSLLERCGWVSFSGPQAAMALSGDVTDRAAAHLRGMLDGTNRKLKWLETSISLTSVRSGAAEGVLIPCNLSMLNSLIGTEYMPDLKGAVVCIEDISEPPYRIDRMLWQLKTSSVLDDISALVIGSFNWNDENISDIVSDLAMQMFNSDGFPVWKDLPYGHIADRLTLPVGAWITIDDDGVMLLQEEVK